MAKNKKLEKELKACKEAWEKERSIYMPLYNHLKSIEAQLNNYEKYSAELDNRYQQLTDISLKRLGEEPKSSCGELLREVNMIMMRNKGKIISRFNEKEREQIVNDFRQIQEKLEGAIKSYHLLF
jgi:hypothetical protein